MGRVTLMMVVVLSVFTFVRAEDSNNDVNRCPFQLPSTSSMEAFNGKCYQFVGEERYWTGARDYCIHHGGRLVKIDDANTNHFIVQTLNSLWWRNNGVWIGLNDRNVEMNWQWIGTLPYTSERLDWTNWGSGHPRAFLHSMRDCVRMVRGQGDWLWHETPCQALKWQYRFICEYDMSPVSAASDVPTTTLAQVWVPVNKFAARNPDSSERKEHGRLFSTSERSTLLSTNVLQAVRDKEPVKIEVLDHGVMPVHQAVQDNEQLQSADSKWYIALICVAAAALVLIVGLLLWRRRRSSKLAFQVTDPESLGARPKTISSGKLSEKATCQHRASPNVYTSSESMRRESNVYEDIGGMLRQVSTSSDDDGESPIPSSASLVRTESNSYTAMDGYCNSKAKCLTGNVSQVAVASLYGVEKSLPGYDEENGTAKAGEYIGQSPDDAADGRMMAYDTPRQENIYAEIPGADCDIYESLDDLKL